MRFEQLALPYDDGRDDHGGAAFAGRPRGRSPKRMVNIALLVDMGETLLYM